ncbi:MAG: hypothetical protein ACWGQW_11230 [bacterium]
MKRYIERVKFYSGSMILPRQARIIPDDEYDLEVIYQEENT